MLSERLKEAVAIREDGTTTMVEHAEALLQHDVVWHAYSDLLKSGPTAGLDREPLGAIMAGESDPACVKDALLDAQTRLKARNALTSELDAAINHIIDFLTNRRSIIARCKKLENDNPGMAYLENLMQRMARAGILG